MSAIDLSLCFTYAYSDGSFGDFKETVTTDSPSTNLIDLDKANINIAGVHPPWLILKVDNDNNVGGAVSIEISLESDSAVGFSTNKKQLYRWRFLQGAMTAGALLINQPIGNFKFQRYLRLYYDVFTSATTCKFIAWLANGPEPAVQDLDQVVSAT